MKVFQQSGRQGRRSYQRRPSWFGTEVDMCWCRFWCQVFWPRFVIAERHVRYWFRYCGWVAEWFRAPVLKCGIGHSAPSRYDASIRRRHPVCARFIAFIAAALRQKMDYSAADLRLARHRTQAARAAKAPALGEVQGLGFVRLEPAPWEGLSVRVWQRKARSFVPDLRIRRMRPRPSQRKAPPVRAGRRRVLSWGWSASTLGQSDRLRQQCALSDLRSSRL